MAKKVTDVKYEDGGAVISYDDNSSTYAQYANQPAPNDNFQLLKNPTNGKIIQVGKGDFQQYGQQLADNAALLPVGASEFLSQAALSPAAPSSPSGLNVSGQPSSPLDGINVTSTPKPTITQSDAFTDDKDLTARQIYERDAEKERVRIEKSVNAQKEAAKRAIGYQYEPYIKEAEQYREDITDATKGQFATDRRASTAALSFVDKRRNEAQKQVNSLLQQKEQALATLDVNSQDKIDKQIEAWRQNEQYWLNYQQQIEQQTFNNWATKEGLNLNKEQFNLQKEQYGFEKEMTQEQFAMEKEKFGLDKDASLLELQAKKRENYQNNFDMLIMSSIDTKNLSKEYKQEFEKTLGLPTGSFDAMYNEAASIYDLQKQGNVLELGKRIVDLQNSMPEGMHLKIGDHDIYGTAVASQADQVALQKNLLELQKLEMDLEGKSIDNETAYLNYNKLIKEMEGRVDEKSKMFDYQNSKVENSISLIDEALKITKPGTTGWSASLSLLPSTEARKLKGYLTSIKANIGFDELQAMRAASPTGGALGQVAVQELEALQSTLGKIDQYQSTEDLTNALSSVKLHYLAWKENQMSYTQQTQSGSQTGTQVNSTADLFNEE